MFFHLCNCYHGAACVYLQAQFYLLTFDFHIHLFYYTCKKPWKLHLCWMTRILWLWVFFFPALKQSVLIRQARRFPASSGSTQWKMKKPREAVNPLGNGLLCLLYWFKSLKINEVMTYWWAAVVSPTLRGWYLIMTFCALFLLLMFMRVSSHV